MFRLSLSNLGFLASMVGIDEVLEVFRPVLEKLKAVEEDEGDQRGSVPSQVEYEKKRRAIYAEQRELAKGVDGFWSTAMMQHQAIAKLISPAESNALRSLIDFNVIEFDDAPVDTFELTFVRRVSEITCETHKHSLFTRSE